MCGCGCGSDVGERETAKEVNCSTLFLLQERFVPTVAQDEQRNLRTTKHSSVLENFLMSNHKCLLPIIFAIIILSVLALPVFAVTYNPGVSVGQYVKYGNFAGVGQGFETFNDYGFLNLQVISVSGKEVTLLSTGEFKNGTALPGNDTTFVWNIETGTNNGTPSTQGPIIAANLNQGDAIPPPDTYAVNQSASRTYLGYSRTVNILNVEISTSDYNSTLTYVYDKLSGMILESSTQTTTQSEPQPVISSYSYSIIETNIFNATSTPFNFQLIQYPVFAIVLILVIVAIVILLLRKRKS
jgi:hypothetical protein